MGKVKDKLGINYTEIVDWICTYLKEHNNFLEKETLAIWIKERYKIKNPYYAVDRLITGGVITEKHFSKRGRGNSRIIVSSDIFEYNEKRKNETTYNHR